MRPIVVVEAWSAYLFVTSGNRAKTAEPIEMAFVWSVASGEPREPRIWWGPDSPPSPIGWLGNRVVSVLDSGAEGPGFKLQPRCCLRQTVLTHCTSVHQAAKLVAALLRVAMVTAGLTESNDSLPPGL